MQSMFSARARTRPPYIGFPARERRPGARTKALICSVVLLASYAGFSAVLAASPQDANSQTNSQPDASAIPDRIGNIWGGKSHQPSRSEVESAEQRAHEATPKQEQQSDDEVAKIQRQIEQTEKQYPAGFLNSKP